MVTVETSTAVDYHNVSHFTLFPNPVGNHVKLDFKLGKNRETHWLIFHINGSLVRSQDLGHIHGSDQWLDLSALRPGTYFFKISGR